MFKIELHVHTCFSPDSNMRLSWLYSKASSCGIDCIAVTDHNIIDGAVAFREYCEARGGRIKVIVGEEVMTSHGEIIGLFLSRNIPGGMSPEETIMDIKSQGGVVYIPHPYDEKRYRTVLDEVYIDAYRDAIDCIEVHNGRNICSYYADMQEKIANKYNICKVIGSDAHTVFELGRNVIYVRQLPVTAEIFKAVIQKSILERSSCIRWIHAWTAVERVIKCAIRRDFSGMYRLVYRKAGRIMSRFFQGG